MSERSHSIVWIDHREAKIFCIDAVHLGKQVVPSHTTGHHAHHKANTTGSGHHGVDREFFDRVIAGLAAAGEVLVVGPGNAKSELRNYIEEASPQLAKRIVGVEPLDHPSDRQIIALAQKFFIAEARANA